MSKREPPAPDDDTAAGAAAAGAGCFVFAKANALDYGASMIIYYEDITVMMDDAENNNKNKSEVS